MSKRNVRLFLADERFAEDDRTVDAVVRNLEILGETARQIPPDIRERYPEIPWRRVIGLRNIVVHEYFDVDVAIIWTIVQENLPAAMVWKFMGCYGCWI